jgi:hypothetical protein
MSVSMLAVETKGSRPSPLLIVIANFQFVSQGHFLTLASCVHALKQTFPRIGKGFCDKAPSSTPAVAMIEAVFFSSRPHPGPGNS